MTDKPVTTNGDAPMALGVLLVNCMVIDNPSSPTHRK